uniref:Uncharacterized protein n=1 Tax=Arundo donax TaxID=35708 RepID=A0A0A9DW83_ARUDO
MRSQLGFDPENCSKQWIAHTTVQTNIRFNSSCL